MTDDGVRDDIAFIRRTIEGGRAYATGRSPDMMVWGIAVAIGYLGTYAFVCHWVIIDPNLLWAVCIALPLLFSLRRILAAAFQSRENRPVVQPMLFAMRMLWLGCCIFLVTFAVLCASAGDNRQGWTDVFSSAILGVGFFASAPLCNLPWLRFVAGGWWLGLIATYALRGHVEALPLSAALFLLLLALPGFLLMRSRPRAACR